MHASVNNIGNDEVSTSSNDENIAYLFHTFHIGYGMAFKETSNAIENLFQC